MTLSPLKSLILTLLLVSPALADTGYKQLFSGSKGIAEDDQVAIYRQLHLTLAKDFKADDGTILHQFIITDEGCEPAPYEVEIVDLNKDGTPEVFVEGGNNCTSGVTGGSMWLFIKSPSGYKSNFGFPAGKWTALPELSRGYPDLRLVAATGPCDEVWRWNGSRYAHARDIPTFKGGCREHVQWGS